MKFSLLISCQSAPRPEILFEQTLEEILLAEKYGFDTVMIAEHHFTQNGFFPSPFAQAAAIGAKTSRIRVGTGVLLLPLYHIAHIAEDAAMADIISKGRFVLGLGYGYRKEEFAGFGAHLEDRFHMMEEAIPLLRRLFTEESVTHRGQFFRMDGMSVTPKPVQNAGPPIWLGAKKTQAVRQAARLADAWFADPVTPPKVQKERFAAYKEALEQSGKTVDRVERPVMREFYVAEDSEQAWEECREQVIEIYRDYYAWGHLQDEEGREMDPSEKTDVWGMLRRRFVIGDPETCIRQLEQTQRDLAADNVVLRVQFPGLPHAKVMQAIKLCGEEVMPHFR